MSLTIFRTVACVLGAVATLAATQTHAQETGETQASEPQAVTYEDGGRFRFGVNGAVGYESVGPVGGPMFGADVRVGYQINDLIGIYAQPHLSFGSLSTSGASSVSGATGTFALTALGEITINDLIFVGAGAGYGILNNPSGFTLHGRAGLYPLSGHDDDGAGRTGLMVGADIKTVFIDGATGVLVTATVGYESF